MTESMAFLLERCFNPERYGGLNEIRQSLEKMGEGYAEKLGSRMRRLLATKYTSLEEFKAITGETCANEESMWASIAQVYTYLFSKEAPDVTKLVLRRNQPRITDMGTFLAYNLTEQEGQVSAIVNGYFKDTSVRQSVAVGDVVDVGELQWLVADISLTEKTGTVAPIGSVTLRVFGPSPLGEGNWV